MNIVCILNKAAMASVLHEAACATESDSNAYISIQTYELSYIQGHGKTYLIVMS